MKYILYNSIRQQSTQTNIIYIEYLSIYDRPKRGKGRPQGSKYTDAENAEQARQSTMTYYYNNIEKYRKRLSYHQK